MNNLHRDEKVWLLLNSIVYGNNAFSINAIHQVFMPIIVTVEEYNKIIILTN